MKWVAFVLMSAAFVWAARYYIMSRLDDGKCDCKDCVECAARKNGAV